MWEGILGHEKQKKFLEKYLREENRPHALLFTGPAGLGKGLLARAFAESLLCFNSRGQDNCPSCRQFALNTHPDFLEISIREDKKSIIIDQIKELIAGSAFAPVLGKNKVLLINDSDLMTNEAANALLKLLEEPPQGWVLLLLATKEDLLLPTILSRVITLRFNPLPEKDLVEIFLKHTKDPSHGALFAKLAEGSIGTALNFYEQDALKLRQHGCKLLTSLPTRFPMTMAVAAVKDLENQKRLERADILLWLQLVQLMLRDALVLAYGSQGLYNSDLHFELSQLGANAGISGLQAALRTVEQAYKNINKSISVKQVMEDFILALNINLRRN